MKIADISHYQGKVDWAQANNELELVTFRSSIGDSIDTKYIYNTQNCKVPYGAYHYFKAGTADEAKTEAAFFYKTASAANPLFYVFDIEYSKQTSKTTKIVCEAALKTLRNLTNKKVGLYIGQSRYPYIKDIRNDFDFIWIPRYGKNTGYIDMNYKPKYPCDIWQYTSKGKLSGVKGRVDLNTLMGSKTLNWYIKEEKIIPDFSFYYLGKRTIRIKNQGEDVKELQVSLNKIGFNCGLTDGKFGEKTKAALKKYQKARGLEADGVCGKQTTKQLLTEIISFERQLNGNTHNK